MRALLGYIRRDETGLYLDSHLFRDAAGAVACPDHTEALLGIIVGRTVVIDVNNRRETARLLAAAEKQG